MQKLKYLALAAFGLSTQLWAQAPIFDATRPPPDSKGERQTVASARAGENAGEDVPQERSLQMRLYEQLQTLQQEVMELRGQVEEQSHQLRQLKQQSLDRYIELDRRLSSMSEGGSGKKATASKSSSGSSGPTPVVTVPEEEIDAYRAAYELVRAKQFNEAIDEFDRFLETYPEGTYAPNAWYWTGELNLVSTPRNLKAAESAFSKLLEKYPDHSKVPDAMYKLGKVYYLDGRKDASKQILTKLLDKHGDSKRSAITFARQFLQDNF